MFKRANPIQPKNLTNREAAVTALMITNPEAAPVIRLSNEYSISPTAVAKPFIRDIATWAVNGTAQTNNQQLPDTQWAGFLFRSIGRAAVIYTRGVTQPFTYAATFDTFISGDEPSDPTRQRLAYNVDTEMDFVYFTPSDPENAPHGDYLIAGYDGPFSAVWIDAGNTSGVDGVGNTAVINFVGTTWSSVTQSIDYVIMKWDNGVWAEIGNNHVNSAGVGAPINVQTEVFESGYYRFILHYSSTDPNADPNQIDVGITIKYRMSEIWAQHSLGGLSDNYTSIDRLRVLGGSILVSNDTAEVYKSGSVLGVQLNKNSDWWATYAAEAPGGPCELYKNLLKLPNCEQLPLATGIYGYLKPSSAEDFNWIDEFRSSEAGTNEEWRFNLRNNSDYLAVCMNTGPPASTAMSIRYHFQHAVEFQTSNMWITTLTPEIGPDSFREGLMAVVGLPQWYENPLHFSNILGFISKVAKVGAPILAGFGPPGQIAAELAMIAGNTADAIGSVIKKRKAG